MSDIVSQFRFAGVAVVAALSLTAPALAHDDPHQVKDVRDCINQLPQLPVDVVLSPTNSWTWIQIPGPNGGVNGLPRTATDVCGNYTWLQMKATRFPALQATWKGPNITTSEGDCAHSAITLGAFRRKLLWNVSSAPAEWTLAGYGWFYGKLKNGRCEYAIDTWPILNRGDNFFYDDEAVGFAEYRIGVQSWQHNDPQIGHPAGACGSTFPGPESCYWPSQIGYGAPLLTISGRGNTAKCFHKRDGGWGNGNPVHIWDCAPGAPDQKTWIYETSTGYIRAAENPSKCLHKQSPGTANGNKIHIWDCDANVSSMKSWDYNKATGEIRLRSSPSKCIQKRYGGWNNGNDLHLWDCNASTNNENRAWNLDPL